MAAEGGNGPLSGELAVPGLGKVPKGLAIVGGGVVLVLAVVWWRNRKAAQTPAAVDSTPLAQTFAPAPDLSGGGGGGGGSASVPVQVTNGPPFSNNAAWAQYATGYLVDTLDKDPGAVSTDLGAYLAGQPVTQDQADLIRQAVAYAGSPPVAGPNGLPPSINVMGSTGGLGGAPGAVQLAAGAVTTSSIEVTWAAVTGASSYTYAVTGPGGFSRTGTVAAPGLSLSGLVPASAYTVKVHASNTAGSGPDASITVTTSAAPAPAPAPAPKTAVRYQIQHGDTLTSIANKFHSQYGTTVALLRTWDMAEMDASARKYGYPNSNDGNLIFGGQWLTVGWK